MRLRGKLISICLIASISTNLLGQDANWMLELAAQQDRENQNANLRAAAAQYREARAKEMARPDEIREALRKCGDCAKKEALQKELLDAIAINDRTIQFQNKMLVQLGLRSSNVTPEMRRWLSTTPKEVLEGPQVCVAFYEAYKECEAAAGGEGGTDFGQLCHNPWEMYDSCKRSDKASFLKRASLMNSIKNGKTVYDISETVMTSPAPGNPKQIVTTVNYFNARPDTNYFIPNPWPKGQLRYFVSTGVEVVDALSEISIEPFSTVAVSRYPFNPRAFKEPYKSQLYEDYRAFDNTHALVLLCSYNSGPHVQQTETFWFQTRPALAAEARLKSVLKNHPVLRVNPPATACPRTIQALWKMHPATRNRPSAEEQFPGMLKDN